MIQSIGQQCFLGLQTTSCIIGLDLRKLEEIIKGKECRRKSALRIVNLLPMTLLGLVSTLASLHRATAKVPGLETSISEEAGSVEEASTDGSGSLIGSFIDDEDADYLWREYYPQTEGDGISRGAALQWLAVQYGVNTGPSRRGGSGSRRRGTSALRRGVWLSGLPVCEISARWIEEDCS